MKNAINSIFGKRSKLSSCNIDVREMCHRAKAASPFYGSSIIDGQVPAIPLSFRGSHKNLYSQPSALSFLPNVGKRNIH